MSINEFILKNEKKYKEVQRKINAAEDLRNKILEKLAAIDKKIKELKIELEKIK